RHELEALFPLICIRLCITVVNAALQRKVNPENEYLSISEKPAWALLEKFAAVDPGYALYTFRHACDLPPCPVTQDVAAWLDKNRDKAADVLDMNPAGSKKIVFDFSIQSLQLGNIPDVQDMDRLTDRLFSCMSGENAVVGIGRYNEARLFYTTDIFKALGDNGPQWRTIHLGIDLFQKAGAPVFAPFDGVVHSFRINDNALDYGPAIVLQHSPEKGITFYTLYGHLGKESLEGLAEGRMVKKGERIGSIGAMSENGGWPPHVHFQIISDMLGKKGDFPGVALPDEREVWLSLCPDPNLILGLPTELFRDDRLTQEQILGMRQERIGRNLSISYTKPLTIVRGYMQHLYDVNGRSYLDCVNIVPHVGHCHPHVVKAGASQMAVLNTNSRYLHENMIRYAQRLCSKLPKQLSVCYFVCSGSEANELALRLARTRTKSRETIVLDGAYHGNTSSLIDISPYKHDGPGGFGPPPYVHKIPTPDVFRGCYRRDDPMAGHKYAEHAAAVITQIEQGGSRVSAFICEPFLSCAGQIVLPAGYLKEVYAHIRKAGGVCIAD
ncbi:MAG: aminotransferase class III-fold pyridoxal phosphate-dependent enzyme, partial [Dehalococcoidia bacterium]